MPAAWPQEKEDILIASWGNVSISSLVKSLDKTPVAIMNKVKRLGLGAFLDNGEYITINQFFIAIGRNHAADYTLKQWIKKGFPIRKKKVLKNSFKVIHLNEFWKWAEQYRMHIDFNKFKENALGKEPDWVKDQRKADIEFAKYKVTPWTKEDDEIFKSLLKLYRYSYRELSIRILRTEGSIKRRINDLGLNTWPIREAPHSKWTDKQINTVIAMYNKGYRSAVIKEYIEKSEQSINGKIERLIKEGLLTKHR